MKTMLVFWRDGLSLTLLLALIWIGFHALPSGYWRADDTAILFHAVNSSGFSAFYDPSDWQKLSPSNLTPWVTCPSRSIYGWRGFLLNSSIFIR